MTARPYALALTLLLTGCDLATLMADPRVAQREADAKAVGGACRHALRSLEDCYAMNERSAKSAIFAGWKDMDQYMRDNKIEGVEPKTVKMPTQQVAADEEVVDTKVAAKTETKADAKSDGKPKPKPEPKAQ
jgi:hypothetical protein